MAATSPMSIFLQKRIQELEFKIQEKKANLGRLISQKENTNESIKSLREEIY